MSEIREITGLWWLPEKPDEKWIGTLRLAPKKTPRLRLTIPEGHGSNLPGIPLLLHGCNEHGKPITLFHASGSGTSTSGAITRVTCSAGYALIGISLPSREAFRAHTLTLHVQYLFDWIGRTGFQNESAPDKSRRIHYALPESLKYDVTDELKVEISPTFTTFSGYRERKIGEDTSITFKSSREMTFTESEELMNAVRHLLHFAILRKIYPIRLECEVSGHGIDFDETFIPHDVEIASAVLRDEAEPEIQNGRWLFKFSDVQCDFGQLFQKWLSFLKTFDEAIGCYFTTVYHSLTDTVQHLSLTQALEAYHAIKHQSHQHRDFLGKIKELAETHRATFPGLFDDAAEFAAIVRDNRNYYTHHNPKLLEAGRVVSMGDLFRLNLKLKLLMQACVLTELGIPTSHFHKLTRQLDVRLIEYV